MTKLEMLKLLKAKVCKCQKCPELVANRTQIVFDNINYDEDNQLAKSGNLNSKVVFLGEGPGKNEDEQGRPFVGKAGQLLDNILKACGLSRETNVYILNILKCRPPENRVPKPEEAANCKRFLDLQLKIISPQYIICLGASAANYLLEYEKTPIGQMRGKWYKYGGSKVLCTFHPAYLLRNPAAKKDMWDDLQLFLAEKNKT